MIKLFFCLDEKIRFVIAGAYNTLFGFLAFFVLYYGLSDRFHYMIIFILSCILSITNAYFSYKILVFKKHGDIIKFFLVYGVSIALNLVMLPFLVEILKIHPTISQAIIIPITVIISFFAHKHISFK